jgi:hypothetical protein
MCVTATAAELYVGLGELDWALALLDYCAKVDYMRQALSSPAAAALSQVCPLPYRTHRC